MQRNRSRYSATCWAALSAVGIALASGILASGTSAWAEEPWDSADSLRWRGRYAEAIEAYRPLVQEHPEAAVGHARCLLETGRHQDALAVLTAAAERFPDSPQPLAWKSWLELQFGELQESGRSAAAALDRDKDCLAARWVDAELHRLHGRIEQAQAGYEWFVDYYNREPPADVDALLWIGKAATQYARWTRNSQQFRFLVNQFYPAVLRAEPNCWIARLEMAKLFLEKYNQAQATTELAAALALNPQAAEIYAWRARLALLSFDLESVQRNVQQALTLNPELLLAHVTKADSHFAQLRPVDAEATLETARQLCPTSEAVLGRLLAATRVRPADDTTPAEASPVDAETLVAKCEQRNPHCGSLYLAEAESYDLMRRFPQAAVSLEKARERLPQLVQVAGELGLVYMRLGREAEARLLLDEAFEDDPFNVRIKNMLEVLDLLQTYAVITTEHFVIRFDRGQDEVLALAIARHLEEEIYPQVCREMGFEPEGKTLFEIFNRSGGTRGHSWFSARMVGLPYIGTVAACAGRMVALTSPGDLEKSYDWARVLKHEFIHVVNLQQTSFNVPHWFTEALAVRSEELPRPTLWDEVLAERFQQGTLFTLDTINLGFIRPANQRAWALAYCQAELYADYMVATYGPEALASMLDAFSRQRSTAGALRECFSVSVGEFESGYLEYIEQLVTEIRKSVPQPPERKPLGELRADLAENPEDADLVGQLAAAYLAANQRPLARRYADEALQLDPQNSTASYVLGRLYLSIGDSDRGLPLLEAAASGDTPDERALVVLASLAIRKGEFGNAEQLYERAEALFPHPDRWLKAKAQVYLRSNQTGKLQSTLAQLAPRDADNHLIRKKLSELAWEQEDYENAAKWANRALHIDVTDPELHVRLARCAVRLGQIEQARTAYETAVKLDGSQLVWRFELADLLVQSGDTKAARQQLELILRRRPDFPGADVLLESLPPTKGP